jgi:6-pyruvoyltetrahydropterin/6-carboxytetrahydropterin synthase
MPTLYGEWHDKLSESMATLTRIYEFCASHRLYSQNLTEEENQRNFGKCANLHGHGHNYLLEVTVEGEIDERTGMIADIFELDRVVNLEVVDRYDHKNFNEDLEEFKSLNPTSEVITQMIWNRLKNAAPARLVRIRLQETARSVFEISAS